MAAVKDVVVFECLTYKNKKAQPKAELFKLLTMNNLKRLLS